MRTMNRAPWIAVLVATLLTGASLLIGVAKSGHAQLPPGPQSDSRIQQGFAIAPVHLNLENKNRALVGLGSYLVNAVGACNACHTCPSFTPGHSPFAGGDGQINAGSYLAGGVPFGPFVSRNITPDGSGKPAGLTFDEFLSLIRTGVDPEHVTPLLQVMPWPTFRNLEDRDLAAIYEYLSSIPHAETPPAGTCSGPDQ
jgi:hypothetical protein